MGKILLDYVFPISVITPTPAASTAFLKQVCVVAKPKSGQEANVGELYECTSMTAVAARTDSTDPQQLFDAGMSKVYILLMDDLDLAAAMLEHASKFFTVLLTSQWDKDDVNATKATHVDGGLTFTAKEAGSGGNDISITLTGGGTAGAEVVTVVDKAIEIQIESGVSTNNQIKAAVDADDDAMELLDAVTVAGGTGSTAQTTASEANLSGGDGLFAGTFKGVIGVAEDDRDFLAEQAATENRNAFLTVDANGAKSMFYAFGKLLSNLSNWLNQQYVSMPVDDGVDELGEANSLFDDKVSFVLSDDEFGKRLALFAAGGKAIVAPYIMKNLMIDLQSRALQWISQNQPQYTVVEAALLEQTLQDEVINEYRDTKKWITGGSVQITLQEDNFVATGEIEVPEPKALWRVFSELTQTT